MRYYNRAHPPLSAGITVAYHHAQLEAWFFCILHSSNFSSVVVIEHHDQKQLIKGRIYLSLYFQRDKSTFGQESSRGRKLRALIFKYKQEGLMGVLCGFTSQSLSLVTLFLQQGHTNLPKQHH